ncbi:MULTISPECIES: hypothetical protein [Bacillus]|nr:MULTISPECIES: hypothetical protein [Bacillus]MDJ0292410.1 hypothetical protein [Bacillus safensis]MDV3451586.1 hypothetical protein [Bacillus safensis]MED1460525.1 hypothetical protein [Bacillus safensis]WEZ16685.1 hypothetical protein P5638_03045 [Bacillus safensis]
MMKQSGMSKEVTVQHSHQEGTIHLMIAEADPKNYDLWTNNNPAL